MIVRKIRMKVIPENCKECTDNCMLWTINDCPLIEIPNVEEAGVIAVKMSENLKAQEQAMFIAGFQEYIKYITNKGERGEERQEK